MGTKQEEKNEDQDKQREVKKDRNVTFEWMSFNLRMFMTH